MGFSGHEIKGVADHFGGFRAWILERSDFFKDTWNGSGAALPGPPTSEFSRFAPGSMPGVPQNGRLHLLFHARKSPKLSATPPILGFYGHEIKGVADHFGGFRAWIPERSDFFKGPKGPKGPLGPGGLIKSSIIRMFDGISLASGSATQLGPLQSGAASPLTHGRPWPPKSTQKTRCHVDPITK